MEIPAKQTEPVDGEPPVNRAWANLHDPLSKPYRITTGPFQVSRDLAVVCKDYHHLILAHGFTPQIGFLDPDGEACRRQTRGVLGRMQMQVGIVVQIGKEANELELVQAGLISDENEVLTVYEQDPWEILHPIVAEMSVQEIREVTGYSRSMAFMIKRGDRRPSPERMRLLEEAFANPE